MTNRNMVKSVDGKAAAAIPPSDRDQPRAMPAPESDRAPATRDDPLDSPQPKPMVGQGKTKGLTAPR